MTPAIYQSSVGKNGSPAWVHDAIIEDEDTETLNYGVRRDMVRIGGWRLWSEVASINRGCRERGPYGVNMDKGISGKAKSQFKE